MNRIHLLEQFPQVDYVFSSNGELSFLSFIKSYRSENIKTKLNGILSKTQ